MALVNWIWLWISSESKNQRANYQKLPSWVKHWKSSLTKRLLEWTTHCDRYSGTTRDSIYIRYDKFDKQFFSYWYCWIRKIRVHEDLEFYSVIRKHSNNWKRTFVYWCWMHLLVWNHQEYVHHVSHSQRKKGLHVILVNKWDLIEKLNTARDFEKDLKERIAPFTDVHCICWVVEKQKDFQSDGNNTGSYWKRVRKVNIRAQWCFIARNKAYCTASAQGKIHKNQIHRTVAFALSCFCIFCNHPKHIKPSYRFPWKQNSSELELRWCADSHYFQEK